MIISLYIVVCAQGSALLNMVKNVFPKKDNFNAGMKVYTLPWNTRKTLPFSTLAKSVNKKTWIDKINIDNNTEKPCKILYSTYELSYGSSFTFN